MLNLEINTMRHASLFNNIKFGEEPVTVIGAGATGSWLVLALAKLGVSNITVWDFDKIEEHNLANQAYGIEDIGLYKVHALYMLVKAQTGLEIKPRNERFVSQPLSGYVFLMVDSMSARKEIFESSIMMKPLVKLMVEPRMGLNEGRVYCVEPSNINHIKRWQDAWYPDDVTEVSACGTSQSVITTAMNVASICSRQLVNHFNGVGLDNELIIDMMYHTVYPTKW